MTAARVGGRVFPEPAQAEGAAIQTGIKRSSLSAASGAVTVKAEPDKQHICNIQERRKWSIETAQAGLVSRPTCQEMIRDYRNQRKSISTILESVSSSYAYRVAQEYIRVSGHLPDAFRDSMGKKVRRANTLKTINQVKSILTSRKQVVMFYTVHLEALGFNALAWYDYFDKPKLERIKNKLKLLITGEFYLWFEASINGLLHVHFVSGVQQHKAFTALEGHKSFDVREACHCWGIAFYSGKPKHPKHREAMGRFLIAQTLSAARGERLPRLSIFRTSTNSLRTNALKKSKSKSCSTVHIDTEEPVKTLVSPSLETPALQQLAAQDSRARSHQLSESIRKRSRAKVFFEGSRPSSIDSSQRSDTTIEASPDP